MYLVEFKIGNYKIRRYISDAKVLGELIQDNMDTYEYVKIIKEIHTNKAEEKGNNKER